MSNRPAPTSPEAGRAPATVRKPLRPRAKGRLIVRALNSLRSRAFRLITRAAHQARTVGVLSPVLSLGHERDGTIRERRSLSERGDPLLSGAAILAETMTHARSSPRTRRRSPAREVGGKCERLAGNEPPPLRYPHIMNSDCRSDSINGHDVASAGVRPHRFRGVEALSGEVDSDRLSCHAAGVGGEQQRPAAAAVPIATLHRQDPAGAPTSKARTPLRHSDSLVQGNVRPGTGPASRDAQRPAGSRRSSAPGGSQRPVGLTAPHAGSRPAVGAVWPQSACGAATTSL